MRRRKGVRGIDHVQERASLLARGAFNQTYGFFTLGSVIGSESCMLRRASIKWPFSLLVETGCHVRTKSLHSSVKKLCKEIKGRLGSLATGFHTTDALPVLASVKNGESDRARNMAWQKLARTGRPTFELSEFGAVGGATVNSSLWTASGRKQVDQAAETKPPAVGWSRILDRSPGSTRARSSRDRPLE